jgi:hypothetical protein
MEAIKLYYRYDITVRCPDCGTEAGIKNTQVEIPAYIHCGGCRKLYAAAGNIIRARFLTEENATIIQLHARENKKMEYEMKKGIRVPDGAHTGQITKEETREIVWNGEQITYQDLYISVDDCKDSEGNPINLKVSYRAYLSDNSALYKLLERLGIGLKVGERFSSADLLGRKVVYLTLTKKTDRGEFAKVMKESVKAA